MRAAQPDRHWTLEVACPRGNQSQGGKQCCLHDDEAMSDRHHDTSDENGMVLPDQTVGHNVADRWGQNRH